MDTHIWVLPWLSLIVGGATLAVALFHFSRSTKVDDLPVKNIPISAIITWIALVVVGLVLELKLGALQSVDVIGARGFALGSIGGALLVGLSTRPLRLPSLATFGIALTELGIARLWLTHGEMTGLTAVALGTALAVICLAVDRLPVDGNGPVAGVVLTSTLAVAMQMGFTRAEQISLQYWPDIPLLVASGIALGLPIASAVRGSDKLPSEGGGGGGGWRRWVAAIFPVLLGAIAAWWCTHMLLRENTPLKILVTGAVAGLLLRLLQRSTAGGVLGIVLLFATISVAYAYWAGYGVAILLIGVWAIHAAAGVVVDDSAETGTRLLGPLAAGMIVAVHRAVTLQNGDNLSSTDITDTWNLLAAGIGAMLPLAALPIVDGVDKPLRPPLAILRAVLTVTVPTLLIAYLFATQASDALVIGAAFAVAALSALQRLTAGQSIASTLLALFVLQSMPVIDQWKEPSRHVKVEMLIVIALAAIVLSLAPRRQAPAAPTSTTPAEA